MVEIDDSKNNHHDGDQFLKARSLRNVRMMKRRENCGEVLAYQRPNFACRIRRWVPLSMSTTPHHEVKISRRLNRDKASYAFNAKPSYLKALGTSYLGKYLTRIPWVAERSGRDSLGLKA